MSELIPILKKEEHTEPSEVFGVSVERMNELLARWKWQKKWGKQYSSKHAANFYDCLHSYLTACVNNISPTTHEPRSKK